MTTEIMPDNEAVLSFLKMVYPDGPWLLSAIRPDRKSIDTKTFHPESEAELRAWLQLHNGERNCYWSVNPPSRDLSKKAEREDIKEVCYFQVDIDPRAREDLVDEQARCVALLMTKLPADVPLPTFSLFSGGGFQAFWKLAKPIPIKGDLALAEDAKRYNQWLELKFGADKCHNIDRLMRLPGTVNIPNADKVKKGRKPAMAKLLSDIDMARVYSLAAFEQAPLQTTAPGQPKVAITKTDVKLVEDIDELDQWHVSDRIKVAIVQGRHPDEPKEGDNSRSVWVFDVVCQLVRSNVPDATIFSLLIDPRHAISESILAKGRMAEHYANRQIERARLKTDDPLIHEMNQHHATVNYAGKYRVATFVPDLMYPLQMTTEFSGKEDFMNINVTPLVGKVGRGKYFLHHPKRENYDGVQFAPGRPAEIEVVDKNGKVHRHLNLYLGFSVEPKAGDCSLYLNHLHDNVCNVAENDIEPYEYLLNLMAYHVQHPDDPQRVSVSLRGVPGTGKGVAVTEFGKIFGRHFVHMTNKVHLVGKFNAHLAEAMFEFADETLNMNDPEIEALMKTHVSERTKLIERKGIDVVQTPSYSVTWFATNDQHPINIDTGDRRYYPLHVNPACAKNKPYFTAILEQMRDGGRAALLDFLLKRDVTDFNAEKMPWTKELQLQKNMSVNVKDALIIDWANYGHLPGALERMPWVAKSGELLRAMREGGGRELKLMSDQKLADVLKSWGFQRHSLKTGGGWRAPPLEQLQAEIVRRFPGTVWDHPEIVAWAGLADAQEEAKGRKKEEDGRAAKAQKVMELQAQKGL